ncbi:MAG: hypothetical protein Q8P16_02050, partial [bacterium]|nr:hypothetical protein [bacterium]
IKAFSLGIPQSLFAATFNPLYIVYGVLVGILVWNEKLTMLQIVGIALATVGILLIVQFRTSLP